MTILDEIAAKTRLRVAESKKKISLEEMKHQALEIAAKEAFTYPFLQALRRPGMSFICEVKKASPSKGLIAGEFPYLKIAREYEEAGAAAISCLTEPDYFQGRNEYLQEICQQVSIPVLRKDFTVDPYMIYEAKVLGASAVLLICAILTDEKLQEYLQIAHSLGLSALVEAHTQQEVARALASGAKIVGVNNRDLKTFTVDVTTSIKLRSMVPPDVVFISESGITGAKDVQALYENGTDGVLIGELLMRAQDKRAKLSQLAGASSPRIKICGISRMVDISFVNEAQPDYIGFVFAPSSRQVTPMEAKTLRQGLNPGIDVVGVFVNEPRENILSLVQEHIIDLIQLHGNETEQDICWLKEHARVPVIRAVSVTGPEDITAYENSAADYLLLDQGKGGSGIAFDWNHIVECKKPYFLAGGIHADNVEQALSYGAYGIDVSGGVETNGVKDPDKIRQLVKQVREYRNEE